MQPEYILETALYVDDLVKAEDFYTRILGLRLNQRKDNRHVFLPCGNNILLLFNPAETLKSSGLAPTHGTKGPGHIAFAISPDDFDEWRKHLITLGVMIEKEVDWPEGGHSIYFRDPSGNSIELTTPDIWK